MSKATLLGCVKTCLFVALLASGLTTRSSVASTDTTLTLRDAITQTLANNPQLYRYTFVREALSAQKQTQSLRPAIELELDIENVAGSGNLANFDGAEITLALSSVIEMGGKRQARMSFTEAHLNRVHWEQQAATLDVLGALTSLYIQGLMSQAKITLAKESQNLSRSLLKTVKRRAARGATPEAEVMRATAAATQADIRLSALIQRFDRQKVALSRFWGETNPRFTRLEGSLFTFSSRVNFEQLYARVQDSAAIQTFASQARIKDAELALARANQRSDLSWRAGIRRFEETGDTAFTVGFSVPLFSKSRNVGAVKAAMAERNAVTYAKQDTLQHVRTQLYEAWSLSNQNTQAVRQTREFIIPALEKALKLTQEAYDGGRYRYLDLVAAQEALLAAKQTLIDTAGNALLSQALIEQLTGEALAH